MRIRDELKIQQVYQKAIELIVNEVTRDKVKGYVSVPKSQQARR